MHEEQELRVTEPSGQQRLLRMGRQAQHVRDLKAEYARQYGVPEHRQQFFLAASSPYLDDEEQLDPDRPLFVEFELDGGCKMDCKLCVWIDCTCLVCDDCFCQNWLGCVPVVMCCGSRCCCPGMCSCCCKKGCTLDCGCCKDTCCLAVGK